MRLLCLSSLAAGSKHVVSSDQLSWLQLHTLSFCQRPSQAEACNNTMTMVSVSP